MITNNIKNVITKQHKQHNSKTSRCLARARPTSTSTKMNFIFQIARASGAKRRERARRRWPHSVRLWGGGKSGKWGVLGAGKNDFVLATEHARSPPPRPKCKKMASRELLISEAYGLPVVDFLTDGAIGTIWSLPPKHFKILTDGSRRTAAGWT